MAASWNSCLKERQKLSKESIKECLNKYLYGRGIDVASGSRSRRLLYWLTGGASPVTRSIVSDIALGVCALHILTAHAESPDAITEAVTETMEQIIVTGSRIPRRDYFATSPIVTLERTELELSGTSEIKNLLNDLPQVDPTADAGTGNTFGGESFVNLRALGSNRTLILLNGRRYPSQGNNGSVDLNAIPPVLIDRIEIITGGASAVYGSDAMAGAVNFIFKRDFVGFESNFQYDLTGRGDGQKYGVDVAYGTPFANGRGNLVLFADYFQRQEIFQDARSFSRNRIVGNDDTGELFEFNSFASAAGSVAGIGPFYTFESDGTPRLFVEPDDRFRLSPYNALLAPMKRYTANAFGQYDINNSMQTRFELNFARSRPTQIVADEFFQFVDINVDRPDLAPEFRDLLANDGDSDNDGLATIFLGRTFAPDRGPAGVEYTSDFYRGLLGIQGDWGSNWTWSADASYASNKRNSLAFNDISVNRLQQGLLVDPVTGTCIDPSRNCVPVNPFGLGNLSDAASQFITLSGTEFAERSTETFLTATVQGAPVHLPHGDLELAFGAEYRRFRFKNIFPNDNLQTGDSLLFGNGISPTSGTISVSEVYAETRIPLLSDFKWANYLGLDLGVRASDYNILDDVVWTWKLGGEWHVTDQFRVRAMRQRAIRAPGMADLFQGSNFAFTDLEFGATYDECSASRDPVGNGLAQLCIAQGIPADQVGVFEAGFFPVAVSFASNPQAQPEEAKTVSVGFVWQPQIFAEFSTSIDYFNIEIDNALANANHIDLARLCFLSQNPTDPACNTFTRAPSGDIDTGLITIINSAIATSEGIDFALNTEWDTDALALVGRNATVSLSLLATHYLEVGTQGSLLLPFQDCAGKFGGFCGLAAYRGTVPDWLGTARLTYASGPFSASLRWRHIGGVTNAETELRSSRDQPPPVLAVPTIGSVDYFDLTLAFDIRDNLSLNFGVENLLDQDPPLTGNPNSDANTDSTTYDILGQRYFLRATLSH